MISFWVPGHPITKGSGTPMVSASGKPFVRQNNRERLGPWETRIEEIALECGVKEIFSEDGAYRVDRAFFLRRPRRHFRSDGVLLRPDAPRWPVTKKADIDKLTRGILDALTGVSFKDDSQVCRGEESKEYCDAENPNPGVWIGVERL